MPAKRTTARKSKPRAVSPTIVAALHTAVQDAVEAGWPIRGIAREAGVPLSTLSAWLSGTRADITLLTADRLCHWLGMRLTKPRIPRVPK